MKRASLFTSVLVLGMGTASLFHGRPVQPVASVQNTSESLNGPFRDGLYVGRLAAERGAEWQVPVTRWATQQDRESFAAGYHRAYEEFAAAHQGDQTR